MKPELRNKDTGNFIIRYFKSFCHAINGIFYAIRYEHNMYIIMLAAVVVAIGGFYFSLTIVEWLFCILAIGIVIAVELINSAIEALGDLVTMKENPFVKIAKDMAAGASLIACLTAGFIGVLIFLPKILEIL